MTGTNGNGVKVGTDRVKQGLAQMLKGGVIVSRESGFATTNSLTALLQRTSSARLRFSPFLFWILAYLLES